MPFCTNNFKKQDLPALLPFFKGRYQRESYLRGVLSTILNKNYHSPITLTICKTFAIQKTHLQSGFFLFAPGVNLLGKNRDIGLQYVCI